MNKSGYEPIDPIRLEEENRDLKAEIERLQEELVKLQTSEKALQKTRNFLNEVINTVSDPIFVKDGQHRFLMLNDAFSFFTGYTREEILGKTSYDLFPREQADIFHRKDIKVLLSGREENHETSVTSNDGTTHHAAIKRAVLTDPATGDLVLVGVLRNITDQKKAEEMLRMERERFFALLEHLPAFVYVQGANHMAEYGNASLREQFGDYRGKTCHQLFHNCETSCERCRSDLVLEKGEPVYFERTYYNERTYQMYAHPFDDPDGSRKILVLGIDITMRKQALKDLAESEAKYRNIYSNIQDVYFETDLDSVMTEISPSVEKVSLYTREDVIGRSTTDFYVHPENREMFLQSMEAHGQIRDFQVLIRDADGSHRWWSIDANLVADEDGAPVKIAGALHDVHQRRLAEEELRHSEAKYRQLVEGANSIIIRWTPDGTLTFFNEFAQSFFGFSENDVLGKNVIGTIVPEVESIGRELKPLIEKIASFPNAFTQNENENTRANRERVWVSWSNRGVYDDDGNLTEILSVGTDITARVQVERELLRAKEQAEIANTAKSEFLANMSHEIRTPLNGVLGMLQLVSASGLEGDSKDYVETALESGRSLLAVINDILDLSRIEAGRFAIEESGFSPKQVVESVCRTFAHQATETGITLGCEVQSGLPHTLIGDGGRIRQILFNLVGNAMKFTHQGAVTVSVQRIPARKGEEDRLLFQISDTGIGIPDDKVEYIFDAFTQVDGSYRRKYQGSGLGLGIVKRLVHLMGGTISLDSEPGRGTTVAFALSMREASDQLAVVVEEPQPAINPEDLSILLAEDNRVNQIMARSILEKFGLNVTCADNGEQALAMLGKGRFDCVLLDIQMPILDGLEVSRLIRSGGAGVAHRDIPIIALTAHAMDGDREKFLDAGMDDFVAKPFEMDELLTTVLRSVVQEQ